MKWKPGRQVEQPEEIKLVPDEKVTTKVEFSRLGPIPGRPCSVCKAPTIFATKRGRAVHPTCEPARDWLSGPAYRRLVADLAAALHPASIRAEQPLSEPYKPGPQPTVVPPAPYPCAGCSVAGSFTTDNVIRWLPQDVWRCVEHNPLAMRVQSWERRGFPTYQPEEQP